MWYRLELEETMNRLYIRVVIILLLYNASNIFASDSDHSLPISGTHDNPIINTHYFYDEIPSARTNVHSLIEECPDLSNQNISQECISLLNNTFRTDPVWASDIYYFYNRNIVRTKSPEISDRILVYSYPDFVGSIPIWRDILDIDFHSSNSLVSQVLNDTTCGRLTEFTGGIRRELYDYCHADKLYRYVTYLDACISAHIRHHEMSKLTQLLDEPPPAMTKYEKSLESIDTHGLSKEVYEKQYAMQLKQNLQVAWLSHVCMNAHRVISIITQEEIVQLELSEFRISEPAITLQEHYSDVLQIAAKAGHLWAILSYTPWSEDADYWKDLYEIRPMFVHRLLASSVGKFVLNDELQSQHIAKTTVLLRSMFPTVDFFPNTYGGTSEAVKYVSNNGPLTFPWDEFD